MKAGVWCEYRGASFIVTPLYHSAMDPVGAFDAISGTRIIITSMCLQQYVRVGKWRRYEHSSMTVLD